MKKKTFEINSINRFVALDFETMNNMRCSVCSVGAVVFENNKIISEYYTKICPPTKDENYYCVKTHGLHYRDVRKSPRFNEVWNTIDEMIGNSPIIAHNVPFEKSCINACGEVFGTQTDYSYIDTLKLSREHLTSLYGYSLDSVCESLGVKLKHHHNALDDARSCGEVFIKLQKKFYLND